MRYLKVLLILLLTYLFTSISSAKDPSDLISSIVNEASFILSSNDPVESKIIKLNNIA